MKALLSKRRDSLSSENKEDNDHYFCYDFLSNKI